MERATHKAIANTVMEKSQVLGSVATTDEITAVTPNIDQYIRSLNVHGPVQHVTLLGRTKVHRRFDGVPVAFLPLAGLVTEKGYSSYKGIDIRRRTVDIIGVLGGRHSAFTL